MGRTMVNVSLALMLLGLASGCTKQEDKLVKEQLVILDKITENFDKVTDQGSFETAMNANKDLFTKLSQIGEQLRTLPGGEQARQAHKAELDQAHERVTGAKAKASKAAFGI